MTEALLMKWKPVTWARAGAPAPRLYRVMDSQVDNQLARFQDFESREASFFDYPDGLLHLGGSHEGDPVFFNYQTAAPLALIVVWPKTRRTEIFVRTDEAAGHWAGRLPVTHELSIRWALEKMRANLPDGWEEYSETARKMGWVPRAGKLLYLKDNAQLSLWTVLGLESPLLATDEAFEAWYPL